VVIHVDYAPRALLRLENKTGQTDSTTASYLQNCCPRLEVYPCK